jgi:hypothetical protein
VGVPPRVARGFIACPVGRGGGRGCSCQLVTNRVGVEPYVSLSGGDPRRVRSASLGNGRTWACALRVPARAGKGSFGEGGQTASRRGEGTRRGVDAPARAGAAFVAKVMRVNKRLLPRRERTRLGQLVSWSIDRSAHLRSRSLIHRSLPGRFPTGKQIPNLQALPCSHYASRETAVPLSRLLIGITTRSKIYWLTCRTL